MTVPIARRKFVVALGGAAVWPLAASAQQRAMPVIGFLDAASAPERTELLAAFRHGLADSHEPETTTLQRSGRGSRWHQTSLLAFALVFGEGCSLC